MPVEACAVGRGWWGVVLECASLRRGGVIAVVLDAKVLLLLLRAGVVCVAPSESTESF